MAPLFLLGALGIALPVIAHILNNNKPQVTEWAAMQFLNNTLRVKSKEIRLRDILLLILRCLAVLLLVLVAAQPLLNDATGKAAAVGEARTGVIVALDASFSMRHSDGSKSRFDRAVQRVETVMEQVGPGNPVTLVMLATEHKVILRNRIYDPERFSAILAEQEATPEALDIDSIPRQLKELVDELDAPQKEIYLISDAQKQDWELGAERLRHALVDLGKSASVFMLPVTGEQDNLTITGFELVSGVLRKGSTARYSVTVHNYGRVPVDGVKVSGQINNITVDSKVIPTIAPGAATTISLFIPFQNPGPARIAAKISGDGLEIDNVRRTVAIIRDKVSVLSVEGSAKKGTTFKGFIASALKARDGGVAEKEFSVTSIPWVALPAQDLSAFDVVILADVPTITEDQTKRFDAFVREGNGLIWFPGESTKSEAWNERSVQEGSPLLPAVIEEQVSAADALGVGRPLNPTIPEHSVSASLLSLSEDLLSEARFLKRLRVDPHPAATTLLTLAGSGSPLLLEHSLGRGQVFMFTSTAEPTWNTMAITPIFPMLLQQMVTYLTAREFEKPRVVGSSLSLSYVRQPDAAEAVFETPSGESITVPVHEHRNQYRALLGHAKEVGYYKARGSLQSAPVPIAVNVDTRESNVTSLSVEAQQRVFANTGIQLVQPGEALVAYLEESRGISSFWHLCAMICVGILLMESLLACRVPKRQTRQSAASSTRLEA
ncbi:MAG: VWA domain-containing protein [Verrucomicrobia bacterium]|nr:VWA domain-containing protein [Verrucomicrobiota bacterium]MBT7701800.1 VWA domain-containing protein [Verrucomicrobiota bacterium]